MYKGTTPTLAISYTLLALFCRNVESECEHNGIVFANGEKLQTPTGGECKVCYCRRGEIQCTEVSCYIRNDCEAKQVPGTCCPKYDNCPPKGPTSERSSYTKEIIPKLGKKHYDPWLITKLSNATHPIQDTPFNVISDKRKISHTHYYEATTSNYKALEVEDLQKNSSKITIQEIIPERKEIVITASPKVIFEPQGSLVIEEAEYFSNYPNDIDAESDEISEVFQQPPPVLRIGDKLLFLKKGEFVPEIDTSTPTSIITIIGAEGLQRGFEDSGEVHEIKVNPVEEDHTKAVTESSEKTLESNTSEDLNLLIFNTAASTNSISLVKRNSKPTTTEVILESEPIPTSDRISISSQYINNDNSSDISAADDTPLITTYIQGGLITKEYDRVLNDSVTTAIGKSYHSTATLKDQHEMITEINSENLPLMEILVSTMDDTSQRFDMTQKNPTKNFTLMELSSKIFPGVLEIINNRTISENTTHREWLKANTFNKPTPIIDFEDDDNSAEIFSRPDYLSSSTTSEQVEYNESKEVTMDGLALVQIPGSIECLGEINVDSGETTTPKNSNAFIFLNENASVEGTKKQTEADDMVGIKEILNESRVEKATPYDTQIIDSVNENKKQTGVKIADVEIIDTTIFQKPALEKFIPPTTNLDFSPIPDNTADNVLKIMKRAYSENYDKRDMDTNNKEEDKEREEEIFKQLLEDASTSKLSRYSLDEKNYLMKRVGAASLNDANIIKLLSIFFNNQHRP